MPDEKICPLFLIFYKTSNFSCIKKLCELWSDSGERCIFVSSLSRLSHISESLQKLVDILCTRLPDST